MEDQPLIGEEAKVGPVAETLNKKTSSLADSQSQSLASRPLGQSGALNNGIGIRIKSVGPKCQEANKPEGQEEHSKAGYSDQGNSHTGNFAKKPVLTENPASQVFWSEGKEIRFNDPIKQSKPKREDTGPVKTIGNRLEGKQPKLIGRSQPNCAVCEEKVYSSELTTIEGCMHILHVQCILPYLQFKLSEGKTNITCPQCEVLISEHFLRRVLKEDDMLKYYRFSAYSFIERMKVAGEPRWVSCQEPNCNEIFVFVRTHERGKGPRTNLLECRKTNKKRCALCQSDYHPHFDSCEQFRNSRDPNSNEARLLEMVEKNKWKQCPKCKLYVEKNEGCNHIHCRCGQHFCYVCRGPYPNCNCPGARENLQVVPAHLLN